MLLTNNLWVKDSGCGGKRVNGRIKPLLGDGPIESDDGVKVAVCGNDSGIGLVVSRDIYCLEGGDGALLC